jgi:hypothetical protein
MRIESLWVFILSGGITNTQSVAELVQVIVLKGEDLIVPVYSTMRGPLIDLAGIREELKRIGTNINQITHACHVADSDSQKVFHALRVAEQYKTRSEWQISIRC